MKNDAVRWRRKATDGGNRRSKGDGGHVREANMMDGIVLIFVQTPVGENEIGAECTHGKKYSA